MQAVGHNVIVLRAKQTEKRHHGIIIPNNSDSDFFVAELLSIGSEVKDEKLHPGQKLFVSSHAHKVKLGDSDDGDEIFLLEYDEILAIVDDDEL